MAAPLKYHGISRTTGNGYLDKGPQLVLTTEGGALRVVDLDTALLARIIKDAAALLVSELRLAAEAAQAQDDRTQQAIQRVVEGHPALLQLGLLPAVCTDPECTIPRRPGRPMHGPHDFRAGGRP